MPVSAEERRFIRYWEEQRRGGRAAYVAVYTIGYFVVIYMCGVALGLFSGIRLIRLEWLFVLGAAALTGALVIAFWQWRQNQRKFSAIIRRETGAE